MLETVRLRWTFEGHVLVQMQDRTLLGEKSGLPGIEKRGNESPTQAAMRMWNVLFKLPVDMALFVEDSMDDKEIKGYAGLRCVERRHFIEVKLVAPDHNALSQVGLPSHEDFSAMEPQDEHSGGEALRKFRWVQADACRGMWSESDTVSSMDFRANASASQEKLKRFLVEAGVDLKAWEGSSRGDKTSMLTKEVSQGQSSLTKTSCGIQRCTNVVVLRVWSPDRKLMLVNKGSKYPSGEKEWNARLPGLKKEGEESLKDAVLRKCEHQLRFSEDDIYFPNESAWEYFDYTETSSRYNFPTKYQKFFVDVVLEDDDDLWERVRLTGRVESTRPEGMEASQTLALFAMVRPK